MASLTVRQLDEKLKKQLRLRAAKNGRSVEDEVRTILRGAVLVEQLDAITRDGLVLAPETVAAIGQAEARRGRWMTVALWAIAALLAWIMWRVL